jgi:hypothetical protein
MILVDLLVDPNHGRCIPRRLIELQVEYKDSNTLIIHQKNYIDKIIKTFDLSSIISIAQSEQLITESSFNYTSLDSNIFVFVLSNIQ